MIDGDQRHVGERVVSAACCGDVHWFGYVVPTAYLSTQTSPDRIASQLRLPVQCQSTSNTWTRTRSPTASIGALTGVPTGTVGALGQTSVDPVAAAYAAVSVPVMTGE